MKRHLLNLLTVLSLLLCVAAVALWVRSYRVRDMVGATVGAHSLWVTSGYGRLDVELLSWDTNEGLGWRHFTFAASPETRPGPGVSLFRAYESTTARRTPTRGLIFPYWATLAPAAAAPTLWIVLRRRRHRRRRNGLCPRCGYDLRATPDRCPECGEVEERTADSPSRIAR